jgi:hypothetical protein
MARDAGPDPGTPGTPAGTSDATPAGTAGELPHGLAAAVPRSPGAFGVLAVMVLVVGPVALGSLYAGWGFATGCFKSCSADGQPRPVLAAVYLLVTLAAAALPPVAVLFYRRATPRQRWWQNIYYSGLGGFVVVYLAAEYLLPRGG